MATTKKATTKKAAAKKTVLKKKEDNKKNARPDTNRRDRPQEVEEVLGMAIGHYITYKDRKEIALTKNAAGRVTDINTKAPVVGVRLMVNLVDEDGILIRDKDGKVAHVSVNVNTGKDAGRLDMFDDGTSDDATNERKKMTDELQKRWKVGDPVKIKQTVFLDNGWVDRDVILETPWPKI